MKINVLPIIFDHLNTLRDNRSGNYSTVDFLIFYFIPTISATLSVALQINLTETFYNLSVTFFGIFIALLLNVQVAIFGIFQRKWDIPEDEQLAAIQQDRLKERRELLGELNANLSYLVLVSCIALIVFLSSFVLSIRNDVMAAATAGIYAHFVLTLMMGVKRAHTLFQMEYEGNC